MAATLTALTLALSVLTSAGAGAAASPPAGGEGPPGESTRITLITGDTLTLGPGAGADVRIQRAEGREHIGYQVQRRPDGRVTAIPADALGLVAAGLVDERLFDLTRLAEWGYGDAGRDDVPLVFGNTAADTPPSYGSIGGVTLLPRTGLTAASVDKDDAAAFWAEVTASASGGGPERAALGSGAERIWLDGRAQAALEHSVPQVGAPAAWEAGYTGQGVTVAVLDTGVDAEHPDLAGQVAAEENFTATASADDLNGHGTHVASTIAGTGAAAGAPGVAPGASLISGKVLDDDGYGSESEIIAGMEWAAANADVVNMSLGGTDDEGVDPLELAVAELSESTGALFVVAAGNGGAAGAGTVDSPASADAALAVGAVDRGDRLAPFSGRGPRDGDHAVKPDVTAPGVEIVAAEANTGGHMAGSGTSMAAPHVAGAAALLAQRRTGWDGAELRNALAATAVPAGEQTVYEQGAGRIDAARALAAAVVPDAPSLSGALSWPHGDGEADEHTLSYANHGETDVTLELAVTGSGAEGLFTVADTTLTVPAGGTASTTVTITAPAGTEPGHHGARLTATHAGGAVATALGGYVEPRSADITFEMTDTEGNPAPVSATAVRQGAEGEEPYFVQVFSSEPGPVTRRVPAGEYLIVGSLVTDPGQEPRFPLALAGEGVTVTDQPVSVSLDHTAAQPVRYLTDEPPAEPYGTQISLNIGESFMSTWNGFVTSLSPTRLEGLDTFYGHESSDLDPDTVEPITWLRSVYGTRMDGIPAGPVLDLRSASLARVDTLVRSHGAAGQSAGLFMAPDVDFFLTAGVYPVTAPGSVAVGVSPGSWVPGYGYQYLPEEGHHQFESTGRPVEFAGPGPAALELNHAALGPSGPAGTRLGDVMTVDPYRSLFVSPDAVYGLPELTEGLVTVARGGEVLATGPIGAYEIEVPAEAAEYTVTAEAARLQAEPGEISPRVQVGWVFTSGRVAGPEPEPLPNLNAVLAPTGLDDRNRATAPTTLLHVHLENAAGAVAAEALMVEVSTDGGASWSGLQLRPYGGHWAGEIANPASGTVSLRATASDTAGAIVRTTVTDAYTVG
ncbi:S8 family peptidase [Allonocardiopsis opalescens]|uniref:S8 family peptidase n=1 Tax=Allonocardiopsis opalescens TaxID=1144618 RepID=UPI0011B1CBE4|nr:S8 family serine peptidase [Allonocardiopsis opalescens]